MKTLLIALILMGIISCSTKEEEQQVEIGIQTNSQEVQDAIIEEHLENGARRKPLYSKERQDELDKGLAKDSTIAYLWQQKAMPLFKQGKYELGMEYIDKAVFYDRLEWQDYRAFIKCIFAKTYKEAIIDFEDCIARFGQSYVMDHSYDFYIALSKIQLNEYSEAEELLTDEVERQITEQGDDWGHHVDLFYLGITKYELGKYREAVVVFDNALKSYPEFSDVLYYKGICLRKLGKIEESEAIMDQAIIYGKKGFTLNEDNDIYERYPYQVRWNY